MNRVPAIALAVVASAAFASAQVQTVRPATPKVPGFTTVSGSGGFQGSDDCAAAHTAAGSGDQSGIPFTTGTTGTTGQNDANCYAFGSTAIDNDVWFDWTCTSTGNAKVTSCNGTGVDTKIGVWPASTCPADGTSLACNDDACGLQSTASWAVTAGSTYTIQLGTFPGAAGGSGTFAITQTTPPPCGAYDDGTTENALGLTAGGELGWMQSFSCVTTVDSIAAAYGTAMFPGSVTNGANSKLALYDVASDDPTTWGTPTVIALTTIVNGDTDILNKVAFGSPVNITNGWAGLLASGDHVAGQFPAPMDQDSPTATSWWCGSTLGPGTLDVNALNNNNVPPATMASIGFATSFLLRAENTGGMGGGPGTNLCFGDGSGAQCGCGNESPGGSGGGCLHGAGGGGLFGTLDASGVADTTNDSLGLQATNVPTQPGLFFQGNNTIGGGTGATFGDGIRCCGQNVVRLQIMMGSGMGVGTQTMTTTVTNTGPAGTVNPGDKKCYQYWFRNPGTSPCGSNFGFTNAVTVTWS
jgi:hypothetical protein